MRKLEIAQMERIQEEVRKKFNPNYAPGRIKPTPSEMAERRKREYEEDRQRLYASPGWKRKWG